MKKSNSQSIITLTNLKEIQNIIEPVPTKVELRKTIDLELRKISQERISRWKNAIQNSYQLKLEKDKNDFLKKEELKQKIDEEERKYQNMRYNLNMQKAKDYYFNNKDLVKSFNSSLFYSDILKERDKQIELNKSIKLKKEKEEENWIKKEKEKMVELEKKEIEKMKLRRNKSEAEMNIIKKQFEEAKFKKLLEIQDNYIEGEIIKKEAKLALINEQKKKEMAKLAKIKKNEEFIKLNEEVKKNIEKRKQKEIEDDKLIEMHAKFKEQLENLKKQKEMEKFEEKQKKQQKLIEIQFENLKRIKEEQEKKENKDIEIKMNKDDNEEKMKIEKRNKILKEIEDHRLDTIKRKEEIKLKEKIEEMNEIEEIRKKLIEEREKEKNEYLLKRKKVKDLHEYYKKKVEEKKKLAFNDFVFERGNGLYNKEMINREEDEFLKFAQEKIKLYQEQGKNIMPMLLELKKYKKQNNLQ